MSDANVSSDFTRRSCSRERSRRLFDYTSEAISRIGDVVVNI